MTVLDQIVERTRERLRTEPKTDRRAAEEAAAARIPFAFRTALLRGSAGEGDAASAQPAVAPAQAGKGVAGDGRTARPAVIAEIKSASPSAGSIVRDPDVEAIARDYATGGAAAISIVTEPEFFHGSRAWVSRARSAAGLPVVMKDFIVDPSQVVGAIAAGADAILLLASLLDARKLRDFVGLIEAYGCDALVEVHDERELESALAAEAKIVGVNNRDLRDFRVDLATSERLGAMIPAGIVRVAESGIRTAADAERLRVAGFHAMLVGESLLREEDRASAVRRLVCA
jgi:indole-3-glycerol phosphate synthase